jgi:hypothetical protein
VSDGVSSARSPAPRCLPLRSTRFPPSNRPG